MNSDTSTLNVNRAYIRAYLVYINGIETPVESVSVAYGVNAIPEAEIVLVPDPVMQRFGAEDRVSVQIFYLDMWYDSANPQFRLLFDGEIVSWGFVNTKGGRAITLTAIDYIQILSQIFFFFMSNVDDLATGASGTDIGVNVSGVFTAGLPALFPYSLFAEGLITPAGNAAAPLIKRPIDYVYNLVRGLIQTNIPNRSLPAAAFFAPWVRRTKFHNRFVALPFLEESENPGVFPILRAVQAQYSLQAVQMLTSQIGSSGSLWDVFTQVLQTLLMELIILPTASAVQSDYATMQIRGPAVQSGGANPIFLTNYFVKPQMLFGLPPTCNVFFPSQISHFSYQENFATQPTRIYVNDDSLPSFLNTTNMSEGLNNLVRDAMTVAHPAEIDDALRASTARGSKTLNAKNVLLYPEEFYRGPVVQRMRAPLWFTFLHRAQSAQADFKNKTEDEQKALLKNQLPDDEQKNIFKKYAAYEYTKERYSRREAGLSLSGFNPYPVPGFPCAVFDRESSQVNIFGYVTRVRHTLNSRGGETTLSISYGRTFQESFDVLRQNIDRENISIEQAVSTQDTRNPERIGAIALGPPEPLREIRDVVQNFDRAEEFYSALFHRNNAASSDKLTQAQMSAEFQRQRDAQAVALGVSPPQYLDQRPATPKTAAFQYPQIIQFVDEHGEKQNISLSGIDGTTRERFIAIFSKMRIGEATEEELTYVSEGLQQARIPQAVKGADPDPNVIRQIEIAEGLVRRVTTMTNIRGDKQVVPRDEARDLFESFDAALHYNARPVCTLDEYVAFLGDLGAPEARVEANQNLASEDPRTFPAPYYGRIRRYRPGPPPEASGVQTGAGNTVDMQEYVRTGFPDSVIDWDELLNAYRQNVLLRQSPQR
jgi:hypothetical protein